MAESNMGNYLIKMPDVGEGIAEVEIVEWSVKEGDRVEEDDLLCEVMTDKATVEIPSPVDGVIAWIGPQPGEVMAVGADLMRLQVAGDGNVSASDSVKNTDTSETAPEGKPSAAPIEDTVAVGSAASKDGNYIITMPDVGEGIAEVEIVEWSVKEGDRVAEDDLLCDVMTDKATVEIPSPVDGVITWIGPKPGEVMAVGADLIKLQVEGEGNVSATEHSAPQPVSNAKQEKVAKAALSSEPVAAPATGSVAAPTAGGRKAASAGAPRPEGAKPIASPAVRQRARNAGVELQFVAGSGPAGRITHEDLDAYLESGSVAPLGSGLQTDTSVKEIKVVGLRRRIAAIMQDTKQRIPHFTYVEEIDVTELEALRAKLNTERREDQPKLTLLPFIIKALVKALKEYPEFSSIFDDAQETVYQYGAAHIGVATATPNGLVVPVVRHAEALDIWDAANEISRLAKAARDGKATREELSGSTITISSLGPMGGIVTTPVINSPEVAILGVNKVTKRPVWQDGNFVPRDIMNLSTSCDHRIIDGWEATQFVHKIKSLLETPAMLFVEQ